MNTAIFAFVLAAGIPVTGVRELHREAPWRPGMTVKVMHRFGDVFVRGGAYAKVFLDVVVRSTASSEQAAAAMAGAIDVSLKVTDDTVLVTTLYPDSDLGQDQGYEAHLELKVPRNAGVVVRNSFGNVVVADVAAGGVIQNRFGDVEIAQCRDFEVANRFGNVRVLRSSGAVSVDNRFGDVFLDSVSSQVRVENRYGDVHGEDLDGRVFLSNRLGATNCRHCAGSLALVSRGGEVSAWVEDAGLTDLDVASELGRVHLNFDRLVPFRLEGATHAGKIHSLLPLTIEESGQQRFVSGVLGRGGPTIRLSGAWADFIIQHQPADGKGDKP